MKKFMSNLWVLLAVITAGAAFTACSSSDDDIVSEQPNDNGVKTYTLTIKAGKTNDITRALVLNESATDDELDAQWAEGDKVYIYMYSSPYSSRLTRALYAMYTQVGTLQATAVSQDGHQCTLTGELTCELAVNDYLCLITAKDALADYRGQKGTLADIAANFDYSQAMVKVTSINGSTVEVVDQHQGDVANFSNMQAIVRFNLIDENEQPLSASSLTIDAGHEDAGMAGMSLLTQYINNAEYDRSQGEITINLGNTPSSTVWAALSMTTFGILQARQTRGEVELDVDVCTMLLKATVGNDVYVFEKNNVEAFQNGKYYDITVHMHKATPLEAVTPNDLGRVIGGNGKLYANVAAAQAAQTTAEAMIAYVGRNWGLCRHGLAISLNDVYEFNATYADATGDAIIPSWQQYHAVPGGKWRLPDTIDWQYMLWNYYVNEPEPTNISNFNDLLTTAGGTPLVTNEYYWTSEEDYDEANALSVLKDNTNAAGFSSISKGFYAHVRACLAF